MLKRSCSFWLLGLAVLAGCNQSPFPVAPVQGIVTIDGQPMTGGRVMFAPVAKGGVNAGRPAFGEIQQDGSFTLSSYGNGDGAVVGDHWVSIVNDKTAAGPTAPAKNAAVTKANFYRIVFPRQVLTVVADQDNKIDIAMTSQDIASFAKLQEKDD